VQYPIGKLLRKTFLRAGRVAQVVDPEFKPRTTKKRYFYLSILKNILWEKTPWIVNFSV
jgi:hypothetical protein